MANTTIQLKKSATPSASPSVLANGELAINYADGKIFYKNATGQIVSFSAAAGGNYFGTVNANNTLLVSDTTGDILGIYAGNNISISADAVNDTLTIDAVIKVPVQTTAPSSPVNGSLWWNSYLGRLFIYYTDGDSNQWVEANPSGGVANTAGAGDPAAFDQANNAYNQANAAYDKANSANVLAFNTGIGANNWSNSIAIAANSYANAIGIGSNSWANSTSVSSNTYANAVGVGSNNYANASFFTLSNGAAVFNTANLANAQANNIGSDTDMKGFLNQTETSISFNPTSNVFTLGDAGSGWSYWLDGKRYTRSGDSTVVIPGGNPLPNGSYYITIQNNITGTLTASNTVWNLSDPTTLSVAYVKFNNTCTPKYFLAEERHTVLMDTRTHTYLHFTRGTQCHQFGTLTGYTVNGTSNAHNIFSISTTILDDEDIVLTIPAKTAAAGNANNYFVFNRYAANSWQWAASEVPYRFTSGGFIQYDNSATMTQAANNVYVNSYLIFTNLDQGAGFTIIPGRGSFANVSAAQEEDAVTFDMTGFGVLESVVAYQFTWHTDDTLTTVGKCQLATEPRKIGTAIASVAPVYTSGLHNDLGGLQGGTTNEYYHLTAAEYTASQNKLSNTSSVSFNGNLFFPNGNVAIGTTSATSPLTVIQNGVTPIGLNGDIVDFESSQNSVMQLHVRNANTGIIASTDIVATADNGSDANNYIDLGINGSNYAEPNWTINGKNDGYLYVSDSNLSIGTANSTSATKYINFFVGGIVAADEVMRIQDSSGGANVGIGITNPGYKLDVNGTVNAAAVLVNGSQTSTLGAVVAAAIGFALP